MQPVNWITRLKILIALQRREEANVLQRNLECLGHVVQPCNELSEALDWLQKWRPDLIVTEEELGREQPDAGLRLAECCRVNEDQVNGWPRTRTLMFIPIPDWDRFKRAQRTGAHVIVKANLEAAIRYIQTIADNLVTDRILGPALTGVHKFDGDAPRPRCEDCEWVGALVSYGSTQADLPCLTPVRTALLNILLFRGRGQSPTAIMDVCHESHFLKRLLQGHVLRVSAVKMEMTRLRGDIGAPLELIGAPYTGAHFLPFVPHSTKTYRLAGNRRMLHIPNGDRIAAAKYVASSSPHLSVPLNLGGRT